MQNPRNLAWRLNWYRQSELEGALLLGRMVRQASDAELVRHLTKHCADEARHAWLWERTIAALGIPTVRIYRSYQSFYIDETAAPRSLPEVLGLTHIFERRVHVQFSEELEEPDTPVPVRGTLNVMLRDEASHLDWVSRWLAMHPDGERILERYKRIDEQVYRRLLPYRDRIWEIPGLGEEVVCCEAV